MIRRASRFIALIACTCVALTSAGCESYFKGRAEADRELAENRATVYTAGLRNFDEDLDRETGLPYLQAASCDVFQSDSQRIDGHNSRINSYIRSHGLPSSSRKAWENELFDLRGYFESRAAVEQPVVLAVDENPVESPDQQCRLHLRTSPLPGQRNYDFDAFWYVEAGETIRQVADSFTYFEANRVELFWGPAGSDFIVARVTASGARKWVAYGARKWVAYGALDLRTGRFLRIEREVSTEQVSAASTQP